ncbi:hypothetical protein A5746_00915 [Mycolicibacterium conceptionense]|uniref:hypothetical protein n=1 Tax=Mycolicibacterium conceptionense TaxID=451644 RepID=UPI0002E10F05|nr:hypothetical protein [Mycolicibacterium conceptionense]OMB98735.1 hypothetical protein A5746_00915 [Mycolicibacterium conceptionense]
MSDSFGEVLERMREEAAHGHYAAAAMSALELADLTSVNSPEGALVFTNRAMVYASLNQAETAVWVAENRQPQCYSGYGR